MPLSEFEKEEALMHHSLYEYAHKSYEGIVTKANPEQSTVIVDKESLKMLSLCYMSIYTKQYMNKTIIPYLELLPRKAIH